ncbi:hypothetical protein ACVT98_25290 [Vibrio campbellii]
MSSELLAATPSVSGSKIEHSFSASTKIDLTNLYPHTLSLSIIPDSLIMDYDKESDKFKNEIVELVTKSTIPLDSEESKYFTYNLNLLENISRCLSSDDSVVGASDFISLEVKGSNITNFTELNEKNSIDDIEFNSSDSDEFSTGYLDLKIIHDDEKAFNNEILKTPHCIGNFTLGVELAL